MTKKCLYNLKNISSIIDYELINGNKVLVSIDIGKSVIDFNKLVYPFEISEKILKEFISINNHYYIIEEKVTEGEKKYYKAFSGFEDNKYFLIDELYLKTLLNCVLYDRIVIDGEIDVDIYKYLEE